ncbi:C40 family peptidase [Corynebacterium felinum]|uniref:Cell wall-associated NlpC family hydrolase n=1 Tax=Corynebacterium felinum TaxID=131318 RepID=A0ABU2BCU0_9CORY|nr:MULTISPECIES: C40 family peptidase [Corynebacterium]MDF5821316.1 C40 family peptidase [Corynebacterium felinum]MDO4761464.1 C40 family peptidase [Corynebacterium sp.]MDR7356166.1 cell wall-associated NlpC family hydrolase [Corynebacterium felinum]WJY95500.1 putative endopeptidase precursor [Corynebacterium felinum]
MAKHRRQSSTVARNAAAVTAVAAVTTVVVPTAEAAQVVVPGTGISVEVAGIENVQGIANVPGIDQWIPSLAGQGGAANYSALVEAPKVEEVKTQSVGEAVLAAARSKIGAPYVWGAKGPNAFDCSGLTTWAYEQVGKKIPRTSYAQAAQGQRVAYQDLQPGDIVVFYSGASHVGIYAGNGRVVHAVTQGTPLQEAPMGNMPFHSAVRF